jgi:hypothetical protein
MADKQRKSGDLVKDFKGGIEKLCSAYIWYRQWHNNIVTYRLIAKQRLGKHIPAGANACNNRMSVAGQRISKEA